MIEIIYVFSGLVFLLFFGVLFFCLRGIGMNAKYPLQNWVEWPKVSVLLAARNEEKLILRSLEAMHHFDYPKVKLQILVGNDQSEDRTEELIRSYIKGKPSFELLNIEQNLGKGRGKANVLAHLAHHADGQFYLITDVDVALPAGWVKSMLAQFTPEVGLVSGTTLCAKGGFFAWMQRIDWIHFMGYIKAMANQGIACTSVGNNMAVRAEAYWQTGGYENIDFSITEDYKLFQEVSAKGWGWRNILTPESTGQAWYIDSLPEFLNQRKRWLQGARDLPFNWKAMMVIFGAFFPAFWLLLPVNPMLALAVVSVKFILQSYFIGRCLQLAGQARPSGYLLVAYEVFLQFSVLLSVFFFLLPFRTRWKGRVYNRAYLGDI